MQKPDPGTDPISRSPLRLALPRREYLCAGGVRIVTLIETKAVRLTLNDQIYNLKQIESDSKSGSSTKYGAGSVVWSSTGDEGFLADNADPSHPKMLAEECRLQSSFPPVASTAGSISGRATFVSKLALPTDAVLIVQLKDLTKDADDPGAVLAEERVPAGGGKSPLSFTLRYDPAKIAAKSPSAVAASITGRGGKLLFVLVRPLTIADISNPGVLSLALSRASSSPKTPIPEAPPHF
jgi:uncharacterized lipoprotein YbaY